MVLLMIFVLFVKRKSHAKTKLFYLFLFIFSFSTIIHSLNKTTSYKKSNSDISNNSSLPLMMRFLLEMVIVIISSMEICLIRPLKSKHPWDKLEITILAKYDYQPVVFWIYSYRTKSKFCFLSYFCFLFCAATRCQNS